MNLGKTAKNEKNRSIIYDLVCPSKTHGWKQARAGLSADRWRVCNWIRLSPALGWPQGNPMGQQPRRGPGTSSSSPPSGHTEPSLLTRVFCGLTTGPHVLFSWGFYYHLSPLPCYYKPEAWPAESGTWAGHWLMHRGSQGGNVIRESNFLRKLIYGEN